MAVKNRVRLHPKWRNHTSKFTYFYYELFNALEQDRTIESVLDEFGIATIEGLTALIRIGNETVIDNEDRLKHSNKGVIATP